MADGPRRWLRAAPLAPVGVALWAFLVATLHLMSRGRADLPASCQLKRFTGVPCPTCGGTRSTFALVRGQLLEAVAWNPWIVLMHALILLSLVAWIFKKPHLNLLARLFARPKLAVIVLLVSLGSNWVYVLLTQLD